MYLTLRSNLIDGNAFGSAEDNARLNNLLQPDGMAMLVGICTAVIVGVWEFCSFFPAEIVLWRRVTKKGGVSKSSFAPWTTLALRYMLLCYSVSKAFVIFSTSMPTIAACKAASGFNVSSGIALNAIVAFATAWRAQAIARGVLQTQKSIRSMQLLVAVLVIAEIFIGIFSIAYSTIFKVFWKPILVNGTCISHSTLDPYSQVFPDNNYARDPLLWLYIVTIIFNLACLLIVLLALHSLACRSRGFSKLINGIRIHSLFLFFIILVLSLLAIIWRANDGVTWIYEPVTVIEAAVMIRILLAEQDAARRPLDTTFIDNGGYGTRGGGQHQVATPRTVTRGDGAVSGWRDYHLHHRHMMILQQQRHAQQEFNQPDQRGNQTAPPRLLYQPFSMMDNLGQAFSQFDSRNSNDIADHRGDSISIEPGVYPGVLLEESQEKETGSESREIKKNSSLESVGEKGMQSNSRGSLPITRRSHSVQSTRQIATEDYDSDEEEVGIQTVNF